MRTVVLVCLLYTYATALVSLVAAPSVLPKSGDQVTVSWEDVSSPTEHDYIAVYSPATSKLENYIWLHEVKKSSTWKKGHGSLKFPLINMRDSYVFVYVREKTATNGPDLDYKNVTLIVRSNEVQFANPNEPLQAHLALTSDPSEMVLIWVTNSSEPGTVVWGTSSNSYPHSATSETRTYGISSMCDAPATDPAYWRHPGWIHQATISGLAPATSYFYRYGSNKTGLSDEKLFSTTINDPAANNKLVRVGAFGDMGTHGAMPHSYTPAPHSAEHLAKRVKDGLVDIIFHIGDISYARGYEYIWDLFFAEIEDIATKVPYMVCIGNHEYDWPGQPFRPSWSDYNTDSGGECGVPYNARFAMPGNSPNTSNLWYSVEFSGIHFTVISTEHNFLPGSPQWKWVAQDLASVDRQRTPWLVFTGHRPMYTSSTGESKMHKHFRDAMEPLLQKYKVDLALWGHVHAYERTCPVYKSECVEGGTTHVVIGMAGNTYQVPWLPRPDWIEYRSLEYGYTVLNFYNSTAMHFQFFSDADDSILDEFWLTH